MFNPPSPEQSSAIFINFAGEPILLTDFQPFSLTSGHQSSGSCLRLQGISELDISTGSSINIASFIGTKVDDFAR
jgi:hypothetical protein